MSGIDYTIWIKGLHSRGSCLGGTVPKDGKFDAAAIAQSMVGLLWDRASPRCAEPLNDYEIHIRRRGRKTEVFRVQLIHRIKNITTSTALRRKATSGKPGKA
jgi:hypothetical protein